MEKSPKAANQPQITPTTPAEPEVTSFGPFKSDDITCIDCTLLWDVGPQRHDPFGWKNRLKLLKELMEKDPAAKRALTVCLRELPKWAAKMFGDYLSSIGYHIHFAEQTPGDPNTRVMMTAVRGDLAPGKSIMLHTPMEGRLLEPPVSEEADFGATNMRVGFMSLNHPDAICMRQSQAFFKKIAEQKAKEARERKIRDQDTPFEDFHDKYARISANRNDEPMDKEAKEKMQEEPPALIDYPAKNMPVWATKDAMEDEAKEPPGPKEDTRPNLAIPACATPILNSPTVEKPKEEPATTGARGPTQSYELPERFDGKLQVLERDKPPPKPTGATLSPSGSTCVLVVSGIGGLITLYNTHVGVTGDLREVATKCLRESLSARITEDQLTHLSLTCGGIHQTDAKNPKYSESVARCPYAELSIQLGAWGYYHLDKGTIERMRLLSEYTAKKAAVEAATAKMKWLDGVAVAPLKEWAETASEILRLSREALAVVDRYGELLGKKE